MNATSGRVVVVDDDESSCQGLVEVLREEGHEVEGATSPERALELIAATDPDVVITDLEMPAMSGVDLIRRAKVRTHHATFVVLTAFGSYEAAVAAIKEGADQFLTKPLDVEVVIAIVARAVVRARLSREAAGLRDRPQSGGPRTILGSHPAMQALLDKIQQVAESQATVLIIGETGTGKELVATAIHYASQRKAGPFVKLNCAALAETLLESELFGHERGAFTGATTQRNGRFEQADGGTLFLDEVSEIPMPLQVKLLRFLQEREFERVGGNETIQVDTRVVAATNRPLRRLVEEGSFREDLFYRLNVVGLEIPPLRARPSDIPLLATHFLRRHAAANGKPIERFSPDAIDTLMGYSWPGNVRELENAVEHAVVFCRGEVVDVNDLPAMPPRKAGSMGRPIVPGATLEEVDRWAITTAYEALGSPTKVAESLGVSRRMVQYRIKEWGLGAHRSDAPEDGG